MSNLIARILLAMLMFPLAALAYLLVFLVLREGVLGYGRFRDELGFMLAGLGTWGFMAAYWWALWRKTVRWTGERVAWTGAAGFAAIVIAFIVGLVGAAMEEEVGAFIGSALAPLLWIGGTVLAWRDTVAERAARVDPKGQGVVCLSCGYNMTGLSELRCPECGRKFTVDELFAGQPSQAGAELEAGR